METNTMIIIVVLVLVFAGAILATIFTRHNKTEKLQTKFGNEYDHTVEALGGRKQAQTELNERLEHVEALDIQSLTGIQRERYITEWAAVQSKFVDEPGQAIVDADRLIMEVMQVRAYPVSDFEQRAADVSVSYPTLVSNYRAAQEIALKNKSQQADTEELRQALIYYRALFEELLEIETVTA